MERILHLLDSFHSQISKYYFISFLKIVDNFKILLSDFLLNNKGSELDLN